mmetsp:Transcript_93248/g.114216  ORF Transcript_93248/g.114216 Transcript_93248/m.114216 type:complete len:348 (-) Transcript_93248:59-1102(-)
MSRRPEFDGPPEIVYGDTAAIKYANNSRNIKIQREMADRAIELLALEQNKSYYLLDLGCGSGLSGEAISDAGYEWIGMDISHSMLSVAKERDVDGDLFQNDLGNGLPFREGIFDGGISISTLQWLTNCDSNKSYKPKQKLINLFNSLFKCLKRGSRFVFQFYPTHSKQIDFITEIAIKSGFVTSIVVDYPNSTKAKKYYLICDAGSIKRKILPNIDDIKKSKLTKYNNMTFKSDNEMKQYNDKDKIKIDTELTNLEKQSIKSTILHSGKMNHVNNNNNNTINNDDNNGLNQIGYYKTKKNKEISKLKNKLRFNDRNWIIQQKQRRRVRGFAVPNDSKYTGRKRKPTF